MGTTNPPHPDDWEDRYHVAASATSTAVGTHVLKHDDTFAIVDRFGDISPENSSEQGVYHAGTKFVSKLRLSIQGQRPLLLNSNVSRDNSLLQVDLTNPDLHDKDERVVVPQGTVHLARSKFTQDITLFDRIVLSNYGSGPVLLEMSLDFASDFVDVFEVRGTQRAARGKLLAPLISRNSVTQRYLGRDDVLRQTHFEFAPIPEQLQPLRATFFIRLESKQCQEVSVWA